MPSLDTVEHFVSMVEAGEGIAALMRFYAEHASMQENDGVPRVGKETLLEFEHAAQASVTDLEAHCIRPIFVSGDLVVIRWVFEYKAKAGKEVRIEEIAYQRWQGDLIVEEKFFYDPGQFA